MLIVPSEIITVNTAFHFTVVLAKRLMEAAGRWRTKWWSGRDHGGFVEYIYIYGGVRIRAYFFSQSDYAMLTL